MKAHLNTSFFLFIIIVISSCAGSKKIDFDSAYKFSRYNYNKAKVADSPSEIQLNSLTNVNIDTEINEIFTNTQSDSYNNFDGKTMELEAMVAQYKQLDRKSKREIRKEVKTELRQMDNLEASTKLSVYDVHQNQELEGNSRLAVFIGGGGLALLILGAIFSVGFLYFVGALAIVAGAVLFIIDQN